MSDPVERLPLTALRVFEAAARLGSFKDAAVELGVSTTTVSNLIRKLEHDWGCLLFIRRTRHVVLTNTGLSLSGVVRNAFDAIGREINMHVAASRQSVAIAVGPNNSICVGPWPTAAYTLTGDYWMAPGIMANDSDTPTNLPLQFQIAIVWRALWYYGTYEAAPEVVQRADKRYRQTLRQLGNLRGGMVNAGRALA